jgi:hypothetical protein
MNTRANTGIGIQMQTLSFNTCYILYELLGWGMDCFRHYESILLGAIPMVENLSPLLTKAIFDQAPTYIFPKKWKKKLPNRDRLLEFVPPINKGRSITLGQYWLDQIESVRQQETETTKSQDIEDTWNKVNKLFTDGQAEPSGV